MSPVRHELLSRVAYFLLDELSNPVWHLPYHRLSEFVGRADELQQAKQKIFDPNSRRVASILGLGGIGKSQLALELAYQIKQEHTQYSIFWIQATEQLTFEKDLREIGIELKIPSIEDAKADVKTLVKQRLEARSKVKWIMVLDNADDEELWGKKPKSNPPELTLVDYLPKTTNGAILVTTRTRRIASHLAGKEVIELDKMTPDEAVEMLTRGLERQELAADRTTNLRLVDELACLPLAIVQAASFINTTQEDAQKYLELLNRPEEDIIKLLSKDFDEPSGYQRPLQPVATTWLISYRQIREHHPLAARYLHFMACLHEKNIPLSLLPEASNNDDVIDAIAVLTGYAFIRKQRDTGGSSTRESLYDMHRLVHLTTRNSLRMDNQLANSTTDCLKRVVELFPLPDHQNKDIWTIYLPHAQRLCADRYTDVNSEWYKSEILKKTGRCLYINGKYHEGVKIFTAVVRWREDNLGTTHLETLNLALMYASQGRWKEAEELNVQVIETTQRVLRPENLVTLGSRINLALMYAS